MGMSIRTGTVQKADFPLTIAYPLSIVLKGQSFSDQITR